MTNKPGYKKTKLGLIPDNWNLVPICELTDRVQNPVEVSDDHEYQEIGIRSHGKGLFIKEKVLGKALGNKRVFWIDADCFIVNIVFAWEQAVAKTTNKQIGMIASHRFPMYKPKPDKLDLDYLLFFFNTTLGKQLLELASPGGAGRNKTLGQQEFAKVRIPIPSIESQRKIVSILSTWDRAIKLIQRLIKENKKQKEGLLQILLTGRLRLDGFCGEWKDCMLGDVAKLKIGKTPSRSNETFWDDSSNNTWLSISDMKRDVIYSSKECVSNLAVEKCNLHLVKVGTLLMSFKLTLGKVALAGTDLFTNEAIVAIYPTKVVERDFLFYYLPIAVNNIIATQAIKGKTLNQKKLNSIPLKLPNNDEQTAITQILNAKNSEIKILTKQLEALKEQKVGLMQNLLSGKIRV